MSHACQCFWNGYKTLTFCSLFAGCTILCACHTKRRFNVQKWREQVVLAFSLRNVLRATASCTFSTSQFPKMARTCGAFSILTWKRASRHNRMHFFNISTSKSAPDLKCFVHFDLEMCFAPQHRALFQHFNFKKHFWLRNVLRATTAYTFSTSQLPKMLDVRCFSFFTSQCASCYNGVQFFISHPARWLRTRGFSEPTFRPSGATNRCKNRVFCDFSTFSRACNFFLLTLSSDSFSSLIFSDLLWSSFFFSLLFSFFLFSSFLFSSFLFSSFLWFFPPLLFICPYGRKFDF